MNNFLILAGILVGYILLLRILAIIQKVRRERAYCSLIQNEIITLSKSYEEIKAFFHPTLEQPEISRKIIELKNTTRENALWNHYVFVQLKDKISYREIDVNKIRNFQQLQEKYRSLSDKLTNDRKKKVETYIDSLKKMLGSENFAYSIKEICLTINHLSATLAHYEHKSPGLDFELQGEFDNLRNRSKSRFY
jgi:hypothetical protein